MKKSRPAKNIVGSQVRKIRTEVEISQAQLAAECQLQGWDVSRDIVAKIEDGRRWVADEELLKLARALNCAVPQLFPESAQETFRISLLPNSLEKQRKK